MMLVSALCLWISMFSCAENTRDTVNEVAIKEQPTIGTVDTIFHFKGKIISIFEDSQGNFWMGSKAGGLCRYDGKNYTYFTKKDGLPDGEISRIQEDQGGNIWLDNWKDIIRFDGKQFIVIDKKYIATVDVDKNPIQLSEDDLWFRDLNKAGVYRYDGSDFTFISFENPPLNLKPDNQHFFVSGITNLVNNQIWFGTIMNGAVGYNGKAFEKIVDEQLDFKADGDLFHIRSILLDSKGNLWIGNNGIGVVVKKGDALIHFSKEQGKLLPMDEFDENSLNRDFAPNTGLQSVFCYRRRSGGKYLVWR